MTSDSSSTPFEVTREEIDHLPTLERLAALMEIKAGRWRLKEEAPA